MKIGNPQLFPKNNKTDFNIRLKAKIKMIIPVRCFTCNRVIGHMYNKYVAMFEQCRSEGKTEMESTDFALRELGLDENKYCCRRMIQTHDNLIDDLLLYNNNPFEKKDAEMTVSHGNAVTHQEFDNHQNTVDEDIEHEAETPMDPDDESEVAIEYSDEEDDEV